jgi:hypothetical protein
MQDAAPAGGLHNATGGGLVSEGLVGLCVADYGAQERSEMPQVELPLWCREHRTAVLHMQLATEQANSAVLP